jgi:hypothetical protein
MITMLVITEWCACGSLPKPSAATVETSSTKTDNSLVADETRGDAPTFAENDPPAAAVEREGADLAHAPDATGNERKRHVHFIPSISGSMTFGRKDHADEEKSVRITKAAFVNVMNAKVNKARASIAGAKHESKPTHDIEMFDHYKFTLMGCECPDMMIRLPYNRTVTFEDLRRELEEDYAEEFPSSELRFLVAKDGLAVSTAQEHKWRVHDYDLTIQGCDGTFKKPYLVYMKSIKKDSRKKKPV